MSNDSATAEFLQRLEHLRSMPVTPMRTREIISLERLLASGMTRGRTDAASSRRKAVGDRKNEAILDNQYDEDDLAPSKPSREVEDLGTHRCVVIRKTKAPAHSEKEEDEAFKKEHQQRVSDIQATIGLKYRGFS